MVTATKELTKKEQLKIAFRVLLKDLFNELIGDLDYDNTDVIDVTADMLLREVSIHTNLK